MVCDAKEIVLYNQDLWRIMIEFAVDNVRDTVRLSLVNKVVRESVRTSKFLHVRWKDDEGWSLRARANAMARSLGALQLTHLRSLDLERDNPGALSCEGLASLSGLMALTSLGLGSHKKITDAGLVHVSKLTALTNLNLWRCYEITDAGLVHVSKLTALTALNLSCCYKITDDGLVHVSKLTTLTTLEITDTGLDWNLSAFTDLSVIRHKKHIQYLTLL
jgi:hypothetical protein